MYKISLLPDEYRMLHQASRKKDKGLMIFIVIMLALFMTYLCITILTSAKGRELEKITGKNQAIANRITGINELVALRNEAQSLSDMASSAYGTSPEWDVLLTEIGNTVPDGIGLTNMILSYSDDNGNCVVQGVASSHQSLTDWIRSLEETNKTGEIKCSFAQENQEFVEFEISFTLLPGKGYASKEVQKP